MGVMMSYTWPKNKGGCIFVGIMVIINVIFLFCGILKDPGVKDEIHLRYSKARYPDVGTEAKKVEPPVEV